MQTAAVAIGLVGALVLAACGTTPKEATPPGPAPTAVAPQERPTPVPYEQVEQELAKADFTVSDWSRTDFRIRAVPLSDISQAAAGRDAIPPIDSPRFWTVKEAEAWLDDREPVQVLELNGVFRAYPYSILIWHEIVNDTVGGVPVTVTFCPLCNSGFVFKRTVDGRVLTFGTTGNLRFSNLVMYDRQTESWWQEFEGRAIVGELTGTKLEQLPIQVVSWGDFRKVRPGGQVLSNETGFRREYGKNPYTFYDDPNSDPFLFRGQKDSRLPLVERVLAIESGGQAWAVPYSVLLKEPVIHVTISGRDVVIFFKKGTASALDTGYIPLGRDIGSVGVFEPIVKGKKLTFRATGEHFVDNETGSTWNLLGSAMDGPLVGSTLTPVVHRPGQFWFSWAVYRPDTQLYLGR